MPTQEKSQIDYRRARIEHLAKLAGEPISRFAAEGAPGEGKPVEVTESEPEDDSEVEGKLLTVTIANVELSKLDPRSIDLVLANENESNPHYVVFAHGEPLAKIALIDQPGSDKIRESFVGPDYAASFQRGCLSQGVEPMLKATNAKLYVASVSRHAAIAQVESTVSQQAKEQAQRIADARIDNLQRLSSLVRKAQDKGIFNVESPLRAALFTHLQNAGVDGELAVHAISAAFAEAGDAEFTAQFEKADEWLQYEKAALNQLQREIEGSAAKPLELIPVGGDIVRIQHSSLADRAAASSVPLNPGVGNGNAASYRDRIRGRR